MLRELGVAARFDGKGNQAAVRYGAIQSIAGFLGRQARDGSPAFLMHPCCIELVKDGATVKERLTDLLVRAFDVGYVWDEHAPPDMNPAIRKPKKATRYDDLMNALEYISIGEHWSVPQDAVMLRAEQKNAAALARRDTKPHPTDALITDMKLLRRRLAQLKDHDPDDPRQRVVTFSRGGYASGRGRARGGY